MSPDSDLKQEAARAWQDVGVALGEAWTTLSGCVIDDRPLQGALASNDETTLRKFIDEARRFAADMRSADFAGGKRSD